MAPRLRRDQSTTSMLPSDAQKWLRGEKCGFFQFKPDDELESLWNEYGDDSKMFWRRGMGPPFTLEKLEAFEDLWLNSGESDKYGGESFFVYQYFTDDEKLALWNERGDHESYYWSVGMRKPERTQ